MADDAPSIEDLRARVRALEAELADARRLVATEARHAKLCDELDIGLFTIDSPRDGRLGWVNSATARLLGWASPEEAIGHSATEHYVDPKERAEIFAHYMAAAAGKRTHVGHMEFLRRRVDTGEPIPVRMTVFAEMDDDGHPMRLDCSVEDLRPRRAADRRFHDSEERFRLLFENAAVGTLVVHANGTVVRANAAMGRFVGRADVELSGCVFADLVHPHDRVAALPGLGTAGTASPIELRFLRADGAEAWGSVVVSWERNAAGAPAYALVLVQDVDARRRMEEELRRRHRLDALAGMAAGIAHDFNNLLATVLGGLDLAQVGAPAGSVRWLGHVRDAALRARDLTHGMMTFAEGGAPVRQRVDAEDLVERVVNDVFPPGHRPEVVLVVSPSTPPLLADPVKVAEALRGLLECARRVTPARGRVRVEVDGPRVEPPSGLPLRPGAWARVVVMDEGPPIPPEHLPHVFDPFAALPGRGGGLALATAWSIVHRHGGHLTVEPAPSCGVRFVAWLPADLSRGVPTPALRVDAPRPWRVLVMDDEEGLREVACALMAGQGYEAVAVADGDAALEVYARARESGAPFAAVLLDLTVPGGRGGLDIVGPLRAMDPQVRAIVCSGYSDVPAMADPTAHGFVAALPKPYGRQALLRALAMAIG